MFPDRETVYAGLLQVGGLSAERHRVNRVYVVAWGEPNGDVRAQTYLDAEAAAVGWTAVADVMDEANLMVGITDKSSHWRGLYQTEIVYMGSESGGDQNGRL